MIRISFIDGQYRDIEEPDSMHRDGEFLSLCKDGKTLLSVVVPNLLCIEPAPPGTSRQDARYETVSDFCSKKAPSQ